MDDYPNNSDTWAIEPPQERVEAEKKEMDNMAASYPVVEEVIKWFQSRIDFYNSHEAIDFTEATPAEEIKQKVVVARSLAAAYTSELANLRTQVKAFSQMKENSQ